MRSLKADVSTACSCRSGLKRNCALETEGR